jgi:general secretion pathway protein C
MKFLVDQRLIFIVTLVLTILLAYQVSLFIWQIVPEPDLSQYKIRNVNPSQNSTPDKTLSSRQKVDQIARAELFGKVYQQNNAQVVVQDAPKSTLNYKVRGIYYSEEQSLASVILEKNAKDTNFYRLGDEVDNNIYINQIQADHVLISRNGKLEKLELEKPTANMKLAARTRNSANPNMPVSSGAQVLQSYRRRYENNPMALAKRFQAIPVEESGRNIGYKLKALRGESLLKKLDLQDDDVFVEINGIGLDKPFQALDALKSLTTAENVSLTVLRNGNRETLDFNLQ